MTENEPTVAGVVLSWPCCWHCDCLGDPGHPDPCPELVVYDAMAGDPCPQPCQGAR